MNSPAERLREARKLRGINQVQLAQKAGVSTGLVGSIESGARGIERAARKLAEALDVDAYWLATGQGQMTPALMQPPAAPAPTLDMRQTIDRLGDLLLQADDKTRAAVAELLLRYAQNPADGARLAQAIEVLMRGADKP